MQPSTVYKVVMLVEGQRVSTRARDDLRCVYIPDVTTYPPDGTPGLMAYATKGQAMDFWYSCHAPTHQVWRATTTRILHEYDHITKFPPVAHATTEEILNFWQDPNDWQEEEGLWKRPEGVVICLDLTLVELVAGAP